MLEVIEKNQALLTPISELLNKAGIAADIVSVDNYFTGRNNRTYRVDTTKGQFVIKQYLKQEGDKRDRLNTEFSFLTYAQIAAPQFVAKAYCQDSQLGMALYEFLDGHAITLQELTKADVMQAAEFFCALNEVRVRAHGKTLPIASEACFSIQAHFALIESRLEQLRTIVSGSVEDQSATAIVQQLDNYWQQLMAELMQTANAFNLDLSAGLEESQRCISPSDFGFHNALKMKDGSIRFLDFEYAGWDDPAKMVGDFFSQLAVPIPAVYFDEFVQTIVTPFPQPEKLVQRANFLRLVYRVKWCCIALNIFLPVHQARYQFANKELDIVAFKQQQLEKVNNLLKEML